ncbi:arsenate reductase (glutaredoxin) [Flavobacterium sp.]|uniref:arsenate reductase (glutaredoxin) n=1 Tax=Flavobacterium sp. TaxID=239 RepID=UPI0039E3568C
MIQVLHNPRCSKSRDCLLFLEESGKEFEVIHYLTDTPTYEELKAIVKKLGVKPIAIVRQKEELWKTKYADKKMTPAQVLKVLAKNPILIERPIVINGDKAIIARPLEKAAAII